MRYLLIPLFLLLINCGTEPTPIYTLSTSVVGEGQINPSSGEFDAGEMVTLAASPDSGWVFSKWEGDLSSTQNPTSISMDSDKNVVGVFERKSYPLNITIDGNGVVSEKIVFQPKTTDYEFETIVELTPTAAEGWNFIEWSGDISSTEEVVEVTVNGEMSVTAIFQRASYPLNIEIIGDGSVEEKIIAQPKLSDYTFETVVQLTASPSYFWSFNGWGGDIVSTDTLVEVTVNGEKNVSVTFDFNGLISRRTYKYDSNNNITEYVSYDTDGVIIDSRTYKYDSNGNRIEWTRLDENGNSYVYVTHLYNSNNDILQQNGYNEDGSISYQNIYTYDSNFNLLGRVSYSNGQFSSKYTNTYDSNNNKVEEAFYTTSEDVIDYRHINSFNSDNLIIETIKSESNGTEYVYTTYKYDSNNSMQETTYYYSNGNTSGYETFHSNGRKASRTAYYTDGSIATDMNWNSNGQYTKFFNKNNSGEITHDLTMSNTYDSNNNLTEEIWEGIYNRVFTKLTYNYKYDINNNRIEYIRTQDGIVNYWWTTIYNSESNLIQQTIYDPETGLISRKIKNDIDSNGNIILRTTYEYSSTTASKIVPYSISSEIRNEPCLPDPFEKNFEELEHTKCENKTISW